MRDAETEPSAMSRSLSHRFWPMKAAFWMKYIRNTMVEYTQPMARRYCRYTENFTCTRGSSVATSFFCKELFVLSLTLYRQRTRVSGKEECSSWACLYFGALTEFKTASPEAFIASPSEELSGLTKPQLCDLSTHYDLLITAQERNLKETLFLAVKNQLQRKGVLKTDAPVSVDSDKLQLEKLLAEKEAQVFRDKELEQRRTLELRKLEHDLEIKRMEHETRECEREHALAMKRLELELSQLPPQPSPASPLICGFDVSKNIRLVPPFSEKEVDKYFTHFERVATTLNWPREMWPLLLQCVFTGKAQEVLSALSMDQAKHILHAYELVPEAYRQKFKNARKLEQRTFVEFAHEKERLFDRWCSVQNVQSREDLRQLVLLEDFKNCLPEAVAVYLNEQEVQKLDEAAVLADEFVLTHKRWLGKPSEQNMTRRRANSSRPPTNNTEVTCNYCKKIGHLKYDCVELRKKKEKAKSFGLVASCGSVLSSFKDTSSVGHVVACKGDKNKVFIADYTPFVTKDSVSLSDGHSSVPVRILRDTGAAQSFMLSGVLPLSDSTSTGTHVLVRGFEMTPVQVPLH
ncbi:hypothetical protein N1851_024967 [Merluccius polli]|uniref:SCAN box domain-containing protein n=1 Tax=Merluccius polli TaxID=89951 RepID=A0AA47MEC0_MERPO|nr:hypothetical protein N1851_024967 [Merluccius polli]